MRITVTLTDADAVAGAEVTVLHEDIPRGCDR